MSGLEVRLGLSFPAARTMAGPSIFRPRLQEAEAEVRGSSLCAWAALPLTLEGRCLSSGVPSRPAAATGAGGEGGVAGALEGGDGHPELLGPEPLLFREFPRSH